MEEVRQLSELSERVGDLKGVCVCVCELQQYKAHSGTDFGFVLSVVPLLGRELAKFVRNGSTENFSMEDFDMSEFSSCMDSDMPRHSILSTDSGIERDMPQGSDSETRATWRLLRRGGMKVKPSVTDSMAFLQDALVSGSDFLKQQQRQRHMTANIVVMGDDRALGRLARAYYTLRYTLH